MALKLIETMVCDHCDQADPETETIKLGWGEDTWEIDLCPTDRQKVESTFDSWIARHLRPAVQERKERVKARSNGHKPKRKPRATNGGRTIREQKEAEAELLLSKGFTPHFGKKTNAEVEALVAAGLR